MRPSEAGSFSRSTEPALHCDFYAAAPDATSQIQLGYSVPAVDYRLRLETECNPSNLYTSSICFGPDEHWTDLTWNSTQNDRAQQRSHLQVQQGLPFEQSGQHVVVVFSHESPLEDFESWSYNIPWEGWIESHKYVEYSNGRFAFSHSSSRSAVPVSYTHLTLPTICSV